MKKLINIFTCLIILALVFLTPLTNVMAIAGATNLGVPMSASELNDSEFEVELTKQVFPESYKKYLRSLHKTYPKWKFTSLKTGINFDDAVSNELAKSCIEVSSGYGTASRCGNESASWSMASKEAVEYFMDPRNFLDKESIFMFEDLSSYSNVTESMIQRILSGSFMSGTSTKDNNTTYAKIFMDAGKSNSVNPIYLVSLAIQENSRTENFQTSGESFDYYGLRYSSLYNFYNIGATGTFTARGGLVWASGGSLDTFTPIYDNTENWKNSYSYTKIGGSLTVHSTPATGDENWLEEIPPYINFKVIDSSGDFLKIQYYSQSYGEIKEGYVWNGAKSTIVKSTNPTTSYGRPWTTPGKAIIGGASFIASGYITEGQFTSYLKKFQVNPNASYKLYDPQYMTNIRAPWEESRTSYSAYSEYLNEIAFTFTIPIYNNMEEAVDNTSLEDIIIKSGLGIKDNMLKSVSLGTSVSELKSKLTGLDVEVFDSNGDKLGNDSKLATGYKVKISNSTSAFEKFIVINGDASGDGQINSGDILALRQHLLEIRTLSGSYAEAANVLTSDNVINSGDILTLRQHLLGIKTIS